MFDFIRDHAIKNVWCTPNQDNQIIIEPARLTPKEGAMLSYKVMWNTIALPDSKSRWHVYQIGQFHPLVFNLFPKVNQWISFSEACNNQKMICDIYVNSGVQLPRSNTYYMYNEDRDLIVAVRENKIIPFDFINDTIYIRVYSNEYFKSVESDSLIDTTYVEGCIGNSVNDILNLQVSFNNYSTMPGVTYAFVNGVKVHSINLISMKIGDVGEFVYDSSIKKIIDFKLDDLNTFESTLDNKIKYLLHHTDTDSNIIDYHDDIDIFIINKYSDNYNDGVYYHRNKSDSVRMLTHRDYSIVTPYVLGYLPTLQKVVKNNVIVNINDIIVRLHIRKSGYNRPVIFEANRIKELYKLNDSDIVRAMLGIDSLVNVWKADKLEASGYTEIMRSNYNDISNELVQNGYGYNSISKIIGDTPQRTTLQSTRQVINVGYGLQNSSTMYEYDANGLFLEYNNHLLGSEYAANNSNTRLIENISGTGSETLFDITGSDDLTLPDFSSYRVYACKLLPSGPDNIWTDVTGTDSYINNNSTLKWVDNTFTPFIRIRRDNYFLCYDLDLPMINGELKFTLTNNELRDGVLIKTIMSVPMGDLDLFLNRRPLIKNLDYFINFPEVIIVNKEYLNDPLNLSQSIHVRFTGFCNKELEMTDNNDVGFIEHGLLSNNNVFDIRDDKVLRIVIDGSLKHRDELIFSELHSGVSTVNPINGKPYLIKDIVVPLQGLTEEDTYSLRNKALITDKAISDYLTIKIPEPLRPNPSAIANRYQIFSPFICKIIYDLKDGRLVNELLLSNYNDNLVLEICKPYEYLLKFDPTQEENSVDSNYVAIHPHNLFTVIELDLFSYRFIDRVVKLYANGLINISPFIRIKPI